jgi:transposase
VHRNCCGLDVHKETIAACLIREDAGGNTRKEKRLFGTMTQHLRELAQWLREAQVTAVAMVKADAQVPYQKLLTVLDALQGRSVVLLTAPVNAKSANIASPYGLKVILANQ